MNLFLNFLYITWLIREKNCPQVIFNKIFWEFDFGSDFESDFESDFKSDFGSTEFESDFKSDVDFRIRFPNPNSLSYSMPVFSANLFSPFLKYLFWHELSKFGNIVR